MSQEPTVGITAQQIRDILASMDDLMGEVVGTNVVQNWERINRVMVDLRDDLKKLGTSGDAQCPPDLSDVDGPGEEDGPWAEGYEGRTSSLMYYTCIRCDEKSATTACPKCGVGCTPVFRRD